MRRVVRRVYLIEKCANGSSPLVPAKAGNQIFHERKPRRFGFPLSRADPHTHRPGLWVPGSPRCARIPGMTAEGADPSACVGTCGIHGQRCYSCSMKIELPPEQEQGLEARIADGIFASAEEAI